MAYTKEEFEKMLIQIANDYVLVHSKYELYCMLTEISERHYELMNETSPGFFTLVFDSLISDIFINLTKLIDRNIESVGTIYTLIQDSYDSRNLFLHKEKINDMYRDRHALELGRQGQRLAKVKSIRNKRFAHVDREYQVNREQIIHDIPLSFNDLKKVFKVLHRVLNHYHNAFLGMDIKPSADNATDVVNLMEAIAYYQEGQVEMNVHLIGAGLVPSKTGKISIDHI